MKTKFIPYPGTVHIQPFKADTYIPSTDEQPNLTEKGKVISIGSGCRFLKAGDTVAFASWGVKKTAKVNETDEQYYVVPDDIRFILGVERVIKKENERKK